MIPRIPIISNESNTLPFQFKRLQFPVAVCFAMTINRSQGQTFEKVGLDLSTPPFTHVGLSRVGSAKKLAVLCQNRHTRNVVFHEAL
jgi:ATP-dependent DNA helicase PIF1